MPHVIETPDEFDARHTVDGPRVVCPETGQELFPDGAQRDRLRNHIEPPSDPADLLRARLRYTAAPARLQREEEAWWHFKHDCEARLSNRARYGNSVQPGPSPDFRAQLTAGAARIAKLREERDALDREIRSLPGAGARGVP
jgi:hypothetical protein